MRLRGLRDLATAAAIASASWQSAAAQDWPGILENAKPSIVYVFATGRKADGSLNGSVGSGFMVHSDTALNQTFILTAAHVLNPEGGWGDAPVGTGPDRTIKISVEQPDQTRRLIDDNASVIVENREQDFAVLAIKLQPSVGFRLASSTELRIPLALLIAGFPEGKTFTGGPLNVRQVDLAKLKVTLSGAADPGQSGGPVIDGSGRAVAIVSQNDQRNAPRFHEAVLLSEAREALNSHLRKHDRPLVELDLSGARSARFRVVDRLGEGAVALSGDSGDLHDTKSASFQTIGKAISVAASGNEGSDCIETFGKRNSGAGGSVLLQPFEMAGIRIKMSASARGGQYIKATCVADRPVGFARRETQASTRASVEATIVFETITTPFDLKITWRNLPANSELILIDPASQQKADIEPTEVSGDQTVGIDASGRWQLRVMASFEATASGLASSSSTGQSLVFLEDK
jgi:hypothetical protein